MLETPKTVYVWDPIVRVGHWVLAIGFLVAWLSAEEWDLVHVWSGYAIAAAIAIRLVWGIVGPRRARFTDFVRSPRTVIAYLKALPRGKAPRYLGHNPAGGAMTIALLLALSVTAGSGMVLYAIEENAGPLAAYINPVEDRSTASSMTREKHDDESASEERWEDIHEVAATSTLWLVGLHILGVLASSLAHRENLPRAMITGRKREE
ncbi:cytochrome b/b6 domain-containing protein [Chromatocurvus halotolerans]|uniref:Cytochrome b n=1 Tax=Chromatocurvus halotolerans TaxID=1132028 RepID=A0A4R2KU58_9GAMM|nr:cytochrome b/b6 domain-containing protein [Chromatocurvus halotolerans]TCO73718.1 cytochrome b [Chromatocurvus halotolerans]